MCLAGFTCGCGPHYDDGGSGGTGGEAEGGSPSAGSGGALTAGACPTGGSGGGGSGIASPDVGGCQSMAWPDAGRFFEPAPREEFSTQEEIQLARLQAQQLSGNGKVVVGTTGDLPRRRDAAVAWSVTTGMAVLPPITDGSGSLYESRGMLASCNGSVILQQAVRFGSIYRTEAGEVAPVLSSGVDGLVSMTPEGSIIVDGRGYQGEFGTTPQLWEKEGGTMLLPALENELVYGVTPNGTLIAGNADELFKYEVGANEKTPIGMAAVDFGALPPSLRVGASGEAWVQSADASYHSFLVWRPPAEPISVTCPSTCRIIDVSATARVVLLDVEGAGASIWSPYSGFVDLSTIVEQMGVDLAGRELSGVAISDDGRVVAGNSSASEGAAFGRFFHLVLPSWIFQP
jgi:hypothetical protein